MLFYAEISILKVHKARGNDRCRNVGTVCSLKYAKDHTHAGLHRDLPKSSTKLPQFVLKALELKLKPLPSQLKYAYLGTEKTLLVIMSNKLNHHEAESLI